MSVDEIKARDAASDALWLTEPAPVRSYPDFRDHDPKYKLTPHELAQRDGFPDTANCDAHHAQCFVVGSRWLHHLRNGAKRK
jgi:hypothetical protein